MKRNSYKKRIAFATLLVPLILMNLSSSQVYGMKTVDDYEHDMLFQMDFNQNTFFDSIGKKTYPFTNQKGRFTDGIRYNSYAFDSNNVAIPIGDFKGDKEEELTLSFWWYPESMTESQELARMGDYKIFYNGSNQSFEWQENTGTVIQRSTKSISSNKWVHLSFGLNNQNIQENKLNVDGKNSLITTVSNPKTPMWNNSSTLVLGSKTLSPGSRFDEVEIRKGRFLGTDAEDLSRLAFVPDLHGEVIGNNPHLSWSNDIMPENVLVESSLEEGQMTPRMSWGWVKSTDGGQEIVEAGAYSGRRAMKVTNTYENGNHYNYPSTSSTKSISVWNRMFFPNATNLSVTYYVKAEGSDAVIAQNGDGGWGNNFNTSYAPIFLTKPVKRGERLLSVDDVGKYRTGSHIGFDEDINAIGTQYQIESVDIEEKTILLRSGVNVDYPVGQVMQSRTWRGGFSFGSRTVTGTGEWQRLSQNTKVYDYADYDVMQRGASFYTNFTTKDSLYFDNVKLGYATKVKLYRDDSLLYQGFLSDYRDTASKDTTAPSTIALEKVTRNQDKIDVSFTPAIDKGNTYGYRIQSVTNDGDGTPLSKEVQVEVVSDIKGYSYVLDNSPSTIPDGTVDTTTTALSLPVSDSVQKYLHVKAIDKAGNVGQTAHIKIPTPDLQVSPDETGTFAELNWSFASDKEPYDYKVYKRLKGEKDFQSVSTFNQDEGEQLRVLNLYPKLYQPNGSISTIPTQTFTTWEGETKTLPKSASLEKWMEEPNPEHPKGYGKGLIDVVSVDYDTFNANPMNFLYKTGDEWNYDSIFFGTWDANAYQPDFSDTGFSLVSSFVSDGNGLLTGHDVLRYGYSTNGFEKLKALMNVDVFSDVGTTPVNSKWTTSGKVVRLKKSGLMTKYPWDIGEIGSTLDIPPTHTLSQITYGDVWIDFAQEPSKTDRYGKGEGNFYLTTWNNTGMIQTGHSNGQATTDEQKVLSNTLFYLSQKTSDTSLKDYSSVDDKKPDVVPSLSFNRINPGIYDIVFPEVKDNGTTYEYYVVAIGKGTGSSYQSSIKEATIQSGVKGYRVDVTTTDAVPSTKSIMAPSSPIRVTVPNSTMKDEPAFSLHVKAIDGAGNVSVYTKRLDSATSYLIVTPSTSVWTNEPIVLSVKGSEALGEIQEIYLPNGVIVKDSYATYRVNENGNYPFYAKDEFGQWISGGWTVTNIDMENPLIQLPTISPDWVNQDVDVQIEAK